MRLEGEQIIIESITDGKVAADAGDVGCGDGLTDMYRNLNVADVPIAMGKSASQDVIIGLRQIAENDITISGYLDAAVAQGYLALLGVSQS